MNALLVCGQSEGLIPAMGVQHRAGLLRDAQRRSDISVAAALEMSLEQRALYLSRRPKVAIPK